MENFRQILISGIAWILISLGIAWLGLVLADGDGMIAPLGWAVTVVASVFAALSFIHILKVAGDRRRALRWMQNDPEEFVQAAKRYEKAMETVEQQSFGGHSRTTLSVPHNGVTDVDVGQFFSFVKYSDHYADFLSGIPNREKAIAELFLFRSWTTSFGFRIFSSSPVRSEKIIYEVVNQSKYLSKELLFELEHVDVEKRLGKSFMGLLDERWQAYDQKFLDYRDEYPPIPTRMICAQLAEYCNVNDPIKFIWLCEDFIQQLEAIKKEALRSGVLA